MRLRQLHILVAVIEEGTFTAAANRLHATQSGISAQIKLLEESLNAQLFERSVAGVVPTAAGKLAYQRATRILRESTAMIDDINGLSGTVNGKVAAGLMPTTTRSVVAPVLEKFASSYPSIEIKIKEAYSANLCDDVTSGQLDFAVVPPSIEIPGLRATHLATDVEVFVTAPSQHAEHLQPIDLTQVEPLNLVLPGPDNVRRARIEECLRTFNIPISKIMELDAMMATLDLVARSDWTTIVPGCLVVDDITSKLRHLHPISKPKMTLNYMLVEQTSRSLSPAAQLLRDALHDELIKVCDKSNTQLGISHPTGPLP